MASISAVIATGFSLNRSKSPIRLFIKSGPVRRMLFSEFDLNVDAAFETPAHLSRFIGVCNRMVW